MKKFLIVLAASLLAACAGLQQARHEDMPAAIEQRLREIGRVSAPVETRPLYAPLHGSEPYAGVRITRDLRYGAADRHRLDVFVPEPARTARLPVLLFMHGGAYVGGDKHGEGTPFYSNVGVWAARNGMVGVNMTYRLAPQNPWPAAQEDIAAALRWVAQNIAAHGGDPARVFLMGHSAGASHVANYIAQPQFHGPQGPGVAGAILVSAFYDLPRLQSANSIQPYHGRDAARYAERSPLPGLLATKVPMLFAVAEFDTPDFNLQADLMKEAFCRAGRCPKLVVLPRHSHMSEILSVGTGERRLTDEILAFVRSTPPSR